VRSPLARGLIALGAVAVVVVLFIVLAGGDDDSSNNGTTAATQTQTATTQTTTTNTVTVPAAEEIVVRNGKPVGGVQELEFDHGDQVRFVVRSDVADEVHVHGYDKSEDVPANGSVRFSFPADIEGVFEIELEGRKEQIAELRVNP
jgi:plastocyanin